MSSNRALWVVGTIIAAGMLLVLPLVLVGGANPVVIIETSAGDIKVELYQSRAPVTVKNFLDYVDKKHYEGTIFHHVSDDKIEGGIVTPDFEQKKELFPSIKNEAHNGLKNVRGTLAMMREGDPDSASAIFFVNVKDNPGWDRPPPEEYEKMGATRQRLNAGYTVFGKVIEGMTVVDRIQKAETMNIPGHGAAMPKDPAVIKSIKRVQ